MPRSVSILDTTLRDGAQTLGVTFSVEEKLAIARDLVSLGIDYVEGGYPGANPRDDQLFERVATDSLLSAPPIADKQPADIAGASTRPRSIICAFGMTSRDGRSAANDPGLRAVLNANSGGVTLVGKASLRHVHDALLSDAESHLRSISDSLTEVVASGRPAVFDCEHFFDGYLYDKEYALAVVQTALAAGARYVVLCDTNGGTTPAVLRPIVEAIVEQFGGHNIGIHTHDDAGTAVANTLAAVDAGVCHVQGTINGLGERCGNANLVTIIPTLLLKAPYRDEISLNFQTKDLPRLADLAYRLNAILNQASDPSQPYIGRRAFAHKGGIHASAVLKHPDLYEHVDPTLVSGKRAVLISDQAGRSNIIAALERNNIDISANPSAVDRILAEIKRKELQGYSYENAEASFVLLVQKQLGLLPCYFSLDYCRCTIELGSLGSHAPDSAARDATQQRTMIHAARAEAVTRLKIGERTILSVGEGNGPVNALDHALRADFGRYSEVLAPVQLADYKVRIVNLPQGDGTAAVTRVLIESTIAGGARWGTVGVSANIVEASAQAICDSFEYAIYMSENGK